MSVLTILLVAIFFAAWKAPRWVKEIGLFALLFGFLGHLLGVFQVLSFLRDIAAEKGADATGFADLIPWHVLFGGLKVTLNCLIYGVIIYLITSATAWARPSSLSPTIRPWQPSATGPS